MYYKICLGLLWISSLQAQTVRRAVAPTDTDPNITRNTENHLVYRPLPANFKNRLMVFFPGTNSLPVNYEKWQDFVASEGYHVIGLTHVNDSSVGSLCSTVSADCYGQVREEVLTGNNVSAQINVTAPNSTENRILKLIQHLVTLDPNGNWAQFLDGNLPKYNWILPKNTK
jgi:hypothetical protein